MGVACNDDSVFTPCTLDLGGLYQVTNKEVVDTLNESVLPLFSDPLFKTFICDAGLVNVRERKTELITARIFLVQGALQALAYAWNKEFVLVSPMEIKKRYWGPDWRKHSHAVNKQLVIDKCVELYGGHYRGYSDHACDAKLLAMWNLSSNNNE